MQLATATADLEQSQATVAQGVVDLQASRDALAEAQRATADAESAKSLAETAAQQLRDQIADLTAPKRYLVGKSTVIQRLATAGKFDAANQALQSNALFYALWTAPDAPNVYNDDERVVGMLEQIGADVATILAPDPNAKP